MDDFPLNSRPAAVSHRTGLDNTLVGSDAQRVTDTMKLVAKFGETENRLCDVVSRLHEALERWNGTKGNPNVAIGTSAGFNTIPGAKIAEAIGGVPGRMDELVRIAEQQKVSVDMIEAMLSELEGIV